MSLAQPFSLYSHNCTPIQPNIIVKFTVDTIIVGLISGNDKKHYLEEVQHMDQECSGSNLFLTTTKMKESFHINGEEVERNNDIKFPGYHITKDLT